MLKIERDKVYVDGRGVKVRVVCIDGPSAVYPVIGVSEGNDIALYTAEGKNDEDRKSSYDLIPEFREKKVCYVNAYPSELYAHASKENAERLGAPGRIARIRVEYEEGQFDD